MTRKHEFLAAQEEIDRKLKKEEVAWLDRIAKLSVHEESIMISKDLNPSPWEFVEERYPTVSSRISTTKVLKNTNTAFCRRIGIPGNCGGLYIKPSSTILVLYSGDFPDEIIIVHELLHLASRLMGSEGSTIVEEDFAYCESLPYVLARKDRDWTVRKYLMPYYSGFMAKKHRLSNSEKDIRASKSLAEVYCNRMIDSALEIKPKVSISDDLDRFDFLE